MSYASGKYAKFICDTCGFAYPYTTAKVTWKGNRVCNECYEPKHPQNDAPLTTVDAEALFQPRPEVSLPQAQLGRVFTDNPGNVNPDEDLIGTKFSLYAVTSSVGNITVSVTDGSQTVSTNSFLLSSGLGSITVSGDVTSSYEVTGQVGTSALGTPTLTTTMRTMDETWIWIMMISMTESFIPTFSYSFYF